MTSIIHTITESPRTGHRPFVLSRSTELLTQRLGNLQHRLPRWLSGGRYDYRVATISAFPYLNENWYFAQKWNVLAFRFGLTSPMPEDFHPVTRRRNIITHVFHD